MSVAKEEALSPDELRKRLYQTFKSRGVLDSLKTQLRNQLISELKHPVLSGGTVPRLVTMKSDSVMVTASNSLVADHLKSGGYEYTLSVFYPECGLGKDKIFSTTDLLQVMNINPRSSLYKSLTSSIQNNNKGFLMSLLIELTNHHLHVYQCDADTQTFTTPPYKESLVDKMKVIDEEYETLRYKGDKWPSYESKLAAYRKEVEAQVQAEMNAKLQHFKDMEIARVKMEEKEKSRKEMLELRQEMEKTHEKKTEALINREKNAIDRLQKQQEIEEKDIYMQRQAVLKEIETVRNREADLRLRIEAFEKTCQIQEDKTRNMEELLRRRELAVRTMEDTYDQKLKNDLSRYQLELKEDYIKRTEKLTENEKRIQVDLVRIEKDSAAVTAQLDQHSRACAELRRLQAELETSQAQNSLLTQQNDLLRERLETMKDYPTLRKERTEQQVQVRLLNKQLEELQEENQRLLADVSRPSEEQLLLQAALTRLQDAKRLSEEEFESHRQVLQAQIQSEAERCAQFKAQLVACEVRLQSMSAHAEDIKVQLRQTQLALENEVLRNPKPSLVDRSVLDLSTDKTLPPDIYVDRGKPRDSRHGGVCEAGAMPSRGRRTHWGRSSSPDSDAELVAGAKARISELEKEAEALEEAYRSYQQRALHSTVAHLLPAPPLPAQRAPAAPRPQSPQRGPFNPQLPRSPRKQQNSQTPPSHRQQPPTRRSRSPASPHARPTSPTSPHARVTFSDDQVRPQRPGPRNGRDFDTMDFNEARFSGDHSPPAGSSPPPRRLSSTPLSFSRKQRHPDPVDEAEVLPVSFPGLSDEMQPSPVLSSGDFSELSPGRIPQLQSTARDQCSPPQVQQSSVSRTDSSPSISDSSPQPDRITIEDLTETVPEPSHIPVLLLDTAGVTEEAPHGPLTAPPSLAPWDLTDAEPRLQGETQESLQEHGREEPGEDKVRWERERREREEKRALEREEARATELRELERLENERLLEVQHPGAVEGDGGKEETRRPDRQEDETQQPEASCQDPLQKYMKIVMEQRQQAQTPARGEQPQNRSPEDNSLSEEKDDSIAFSHEDVDEFW
ncbi:hypothetical protein UPYG_G00158790 [Umbra pygmaea]|uniref:LisH domain-containing protein n=1 Tax=Umbra pygmaea TaxID=75934 RepID=A0ABD0WYT3_UMBPY